VDEVRRRSPSTTIILLTGYGSLESAIRALRRGVSDYLLKPCDVDELRATVARGVEHRRSQRELEEQRRELAAANAGLLALNSDLKRRVDVVEAEARARARMLCAVGDASRVLAGTRDPAVAVEDVARLAVPALADVCLIDVLEEGAGDRRLVRLGAAHIDPKREQAARRLRQPALAQLSCDSEIAVVLRTGEPVLLDTIDDLFLSTRARSAQPGDVITALRPRSALFVPLTARASVIGMLLLANTDPGRCFSLELLALAEDLAARIALSIENARLVTAGGE
jgi:hypothetical protein